MCEEPDNTPSASDPKYASERTSSLAAAIEQLKVSADVVRLPNYKGFWIESKQVLEMFKTLKSIPHQDRQRLWQRYREICDTVHARQVEERHALQEGSHERRSALEAEIGRARELIQTEDGIPAVAETRALLQQILDHLKSHVRQGSNQTSEDTSSRSDSGRLTKEDREAVWHQWQVVRSALAERQKQLSQQFIDRANELIELAGRSEPVGVLKMIRALQEDIFKVGLKRDNREAIRSLLNQAWKAAVQRMQQMREDRKVQHAEWKARMAENLQKWSEQIVRREQTAEHLREQITKLEGMLENARSDDHAERVRTWIGETETKLQNTQEILKVLREKSLAVKAKLDRQA